MATAAQAEAGPEHFLHFSMGVQALLLPGAGMLRAVSHLLEVLRHSCEVLGVELDFCVFVDKRLRAPKRITCIIPSFPYIYLLN